MSITAAIVVALLHLAAAAGVTVPNSFTSFTVAGGGFRTLVGGQAATRALAEVEFNFDKLTHMSGNSGGQWFAAQFLYNQGFKDALVEKLCTDGFWWWETPAFCPMQSVLAAWGKGFSKRVAAANLAPATPLSCTVDVLAVPIDVKPLLSLFQGALSVLSLPASDWLAYVTALLDIPDIETLTYTDPPRTLDLTFTQMLAVPQSAFLGNRASDGSRAIAAPCAASGNALTRGMYMTRQSAASAASAPGGTGLRFADGATTFETRPGTECGATSGDAALAVPDPASLRVKDVAAISSAAAGGVASHQYAVAFTRMLSTDGAFAAFTTEIADEVAACFPLGLKTLAPPLPTVPASSFRGIDGGYVDNTAVLPTLAAVMRQCAAGDASVNCASKRFSILFVDGDVEGYECLFKGGCPVSGGTRQQYGVSVPDTTAFADAFPTEWAPYAPWWAVSSSRSKFNYGTFTTVENAAYGIEAGWKVSILAFVIVADELVYPIIAPADTAELTFSTLYSVVANEQVAGMKGVLANWMAVDAAAGDAAETLTITSLTAGLETEDPGKMTKKEKRALWAAVGVSAFVGLCAFVSFTYVACVAIRG
mgnify:CR=1 FL=1|tara:strand:- start:1701 stop:3482 length:1782 start_codon:yes stop_codon:yes gene_type:complete